MLKRLQGRGRERERPVQIGNPVLLETTYDEDRLRNNPNVNDIQTANFQHTTNPPQSQPHYTISTLPPPDYPDYRTAGVPPLPQYSPPSPELEYYHSNPTSSSYNPRNDISPPSSPEPEEHLQSNQSQPHRFRSMRDVSPMDENRKKFENLSQNSNSIPVLRRAPPGVQSGDAESGSRHKFWGGKIAPNSRVKWDIYSGEPTSSQAGKSQSMTPGSYSKGVASIDPSLPGHKVSIAGPEKKATIFSERLTRFGARSASGSAEPRVRAIGRSQIASPVKDDNTVKPLQVSRKPVTALTMKKSKQRESLNAVVAETMPVTAETLHIDLHDDLVKPVVPLKAGKNSPPRSGLMYSTSPTSSSLSPGVAAYPSPITPTRKSPSPIAASQQLADTIISPTQRTATPPAGSKAPSLTPESGKPTPPSRFSWTTYNSATTYQHSPPPSPPLLPATPLPKRVVTEPIPAASAIVNRKRPVAQADKILEPMVPRRATSGNIEPTGTAKVHTIDYRASPISPRAASIISVATNGTTKALPQPPTTFRAQDHIAVLESQREDLLVRKSNVHRLLDDLNKAAPPNPMLTDFKRARLAEQKKRAFEEELTEINREEYDIGMKLHRAWKKREYDNPNMASALWVKRAFA